MRRNGSFQRVVHAVHLKNSEKETILMKPSTEDQIAGALHEVKGAVKEKAGQIADNPNLEADGQTEKLAGTIQKKIGQIEKVFEK